MITFSLSILSLTNAQLLLTPTQTGSVVFFFFFSNSESVKSDRNLRFGGDIVIIFITRRATGVNRFSRGRLRGEEAEVVCRTRSEMNQGQRFDAVFGGRVDDNIILMDSQNNGHPSRVGKQTTTVIKNTTTMTAAAQSISKMDLQPH